MEDIMNSIIFSLSEVVQYCDCKNTKQLKKVLVDLGLVEFNEDGSVEDYDAIYLNCTYKRVRVKGNKLYEVLDLIAMK